MNQQGASDIIKGAEDMLSFPILRRGVGTGEAQVDAPRSQKRCESLIDKLGSVVSLDAANGKTELFLQPPALIPCRKDIEKHLTPNEGG